MSGLRRMSGWGCLLALLLGIGLQERAEAGAWSQPQGHFYAKISGGLYASEEFFNDMGDKVPLGMDGERFEASQGFLYLEYGLLERLTLVGQTNAGQLISRNRFVKQVTVGIGDVGLGVKYQVVDRPVVLTPLVSLKLPTGYHKDYDPAMGTGDADLAFRLSTARSFYPWPFYLGAEAGYRFRGGTFSNQIPYSFEVGATPHGRVFLKGYIDGESTRTGDKENTGLVGLAQVSEGDFTKMGLNVAVRVNGPLWVDVLWEQILSGENIGAGSSWGIGLSFSY